jgi:asparagine synthase (glutamine-hydrolysing)
MCGIFFYRGIRVSGTQLLEKTLETLKARGPERTKILDLSGGLFLGFQRLAINGLNPEGDQPFRIPQQGLTWMCNGEIYNWKELAEEHDLDNSSGSDCEILGQLYLKFAEDLETFFRLLDGVFGFLLVDEKRQRILFGRDPYGVRPLYYADQGGGFCVASERKAIVSFLTNPQPVKPGSYQVWNYARGLQKVEEHVWHTIPWLKQAFSYDDSMKIVRQSLETAVKKRMLMERPVAALLSGGLDSSLIAALVQRELKEAGKPPLKTFSIGMEGSTDLKYAKIVADHIGSDHTQIVLTPDEFFAAIPQVIYDIESFDTTSVRASVGNWLVSKYIAENTNCKVVFNGDGSDEVFGSYLYFFKAPNNTEYEREVRRLLSDIHMYDVQRSDRSISRHGLEPRTPFLDKQFVATALAIPTDYRRPVQGSQPEKAILRIAFMESGLLPSEVLWRQKEAFSDGVSSTEKSWYQMIQERVAPLVAAGWQTQAKKIHHLPPQTPEQYYYRKIYHQHFGQEGAEACTPYFWMPRWSAGATDPSARTLAVYTSTAS